MTGRYAIFWQIIFALSALLSLWWLYSSGNLTTIIQLIFSSFLFWLSSFNQVPEILNEGWEGGIFDMIFSLFFAGFFIVLMFSIPLGLTFILFIAVARPAQTLRLLWAEAQGGILFLIKVAALLALIAFIGAVLPSYAISFELIMGLAILFLFIFGLDLITGGRVLGGGAYLLGFITAWVLRKFKE